MSPIVMPSGYTRQYIDGEITEEDQINALKKSQQVVSGMSDAVHTLHYIYVYIHLIYVSPDIS